MILIDASYINNSGGKVLLEYVIKQIVENFNVRDYIFIFDNRLESIYLNLIPNDNKIIIKSGTIVREKLFKSLINNCAITSIFCFNNIPPPINVRHCPVFIYFHNTLLLGNDSTSQKIKNKILNLIKLNFIKHLNKANYRWIVQTSNTKNQLKEKIDNLIEVFPIFEEEVTLSPSKREKDFIYVADGSSHKNHWLLFGIWEILATKDKKFPKLFVTLKKESFPDLINRINELNRLGVNIVNLGVLDKLEILNFYRKCTFQVFPSLTESFGLPLIEATQYGCNTIASNLPFVHDVIKPSAVFNPLYPDELHNIIKQIIDGHINLPKTELLVSNKINELIKLINQA